ncbi:MAG: family 20 glycosylhydrolase [Bacteroidales bacterium]|nr:family 20 glycosylhydrolase [Bacteroidales bacterium]
MNFFLYIILAATPLIGTAANIVPQPAFMEVRPGSLQVPEVITVAGDNSEKVAEQLQRHGFEASSLQQGTDPLLQTIVNDFPHPDEYSLEVTPNGVSIAAGDKAGLFYGVETLTQLIEQAQDGKIECCVIEDRPRFGYRGMMLDVVRCYQPIDEIKKIVDVASQLKINRLHLHLTDDNGWRMEIKQYPKLTEVGAWRVDRPEIFPARANPKEGEPTTYGGYYTQEELRDLVAYAANRHITVIPEIEMPAHAVAAIASYPDLACPVLDEFVGVLPGIGGHAAAIIMCAGKDSTLQFVRNVLDEVMDVFPSPYIHLGGDEANKKNWEKCPLCQQRIADQDLKDCEELQGWFMDQINSYVQSKGRQTIGWDEVTYGSPKQPMTIMGWQGDGSVAVDYARATGAPFIMTPALRTYFIRYQGPQWFEPFTYFGNITLKDVHEFDPVHQDWTPEMAAQLQGIQGSMWTEFCRTPQDVQYMVFPRLIALADAAWRPQGSGDWQSFVTALDHFLPRLDKADVAYARSMYNIQHTLRPNGDGTVTLTAECIRPDAEITVSSDKEGMEPVIYAAPIVLRESQTLTLQASVGDSIKGQPLMLDVDFNPATGRSVDAKNISNGYGYALTNGIRGSLRNSDFEWAGWHNRDAAFVVDLGSEQTITKVTLGALGNANLCIAFPRQVKLYGAGDDWNFHLIGSISWPTSKLYPTDALTHDYDFSLFTANGVRYIRIEATNPGPVPDGMPREGAPTWICFDEIMIN